MRKIELLKPLLILAFWSNWPIIGKRKTMEETVKEREEEEEGIRRSIKIETKYSDTDHPLIKKLDFGIYIPKIYPEWDISSLHVKGLFSYSGSKIRCNVQKVSSESQGIYWFCTYRAIIQANLAYELVISVSGEKGAYDIEMLMPI